MKFKQICITILIALSCISVCTQASNHRTEEAPDASIQPSKTNDGGMEN